MDSLLWEKIHEINRAIKDLVYHANENWNNETSGWYTKFILEVKSKFSGKSGCTTLEDEYHVHSVPIFIVVQPDNDHPLIRIGGK